MGTMESNNYPAMQGTIKHITEPDEEGYIFKFFKSRMLMPSIDRQKELIQKKMQYFGEYMPETELIEFGNGEYYIKQKYIKGKTLSEIDVSSLPAETLGKLIDLIKKYLKYHREQGGKLDITGCQIHENINNVLLRKVKNFLKIRENFLISTNIMVSDDGNVYMVDVCESSADRWEGRVKNFCAKPFIKRTISNLEEILNGKIIAESRKKEILSALADD